MLSFGPNEMLLILVIALILFGPKKLPEVIRTLTQSYAKVKREIDDFSTQLNVESIIEQDEDLRRMRDSARDFKEDINPLTDMKTGHDD